MAEAGRSEILPHAPDLKIVRAANPGPMTLDGTRSYVLGRDAVVVLDPGPRLASQLGAVLRAIAGRPVVSILLTHAHADHSGLAGDLASGTGAPVRASAATLERLGGLPLEEELAEGEVLEIETGRQLTALPSPGHTADHMAYLELPSRRLFTGDLVLGSGSSAILHPDGSVPDALASLARLVAVRPSELFPGHGDPVPDASGRLAEYRAHRMERTRQVERAVAGGLTRVPEIRRAVYGDLPEGLRRAADASVAAHVAALDDTVGARVDLERFGLDEEDG